MRKQRVVITGMSAVTPIGIGLKNFWQNCIKGTSGIKRIDMFDIPNHMSQVAGIIQDFLPETFNVFQASNHQDRALLFARHATQEALHDAGLSMYFSNGVNKDRCALYISSAVAQITAMERQFNLATQQGVSPLKPVLVTNQDTDTSYNPFLFNSLAGELANTLGFNSHHMLIPTGCAGGIDAITYAVHAIRSGKCHLVVAGASEAPITPLVVAAFSKIGATSTKYNNTPTKASRPFDRGRDGFVLGEGCGILILEALEHAINRNARIYAEITGVGSVNNFNHMTDIPQDGQSIARSCIKAIEDANIDPNKINFINAHGSSTPQNDVAETNAFHTIFGTRTKTIPVTSNKSLVGHALAASNAIEIISSVMSITDFIVPPTINLDQLDPKCNLDVVSNVARKTPVTKVLKTSSGFSGIHSSLIIEKFAG